MDDPRYLHNRWKWAPHASPIVITTLWVLLAKLIQNLLEFIPNFSTFLLQLILVV